MLRSTLLVAAISLVAACTGPKDAADHLRAACLGGDRVSCAALERDAPSPAPAPEVTNATEPDIVSVVPDAAEPEVVPASRDIRRSTAIGIGGSTNTGVGVGVGIGFGL